MIALDAAYCLTCPRIGLKSLKPHVLMMLACLTLLGVWMLACHIPFLSNIDSVLSHLQSFGKWETDMNSHP